MLTLKRNFEGFARAPRAQAIAIEIANAFMQWRGHSPVDSGALTTL